MSREEPVFSVSAQIYILDGNTQNWAPATSSVVDVTFYYDPATTRTRIIGMEDDQAKVNSMILPGMSFMKPSETFGQWLDITTNQLFGLNFTSVADTDNFAFTFKAAVEGKRPGPMVDMMKTVIPGVNKPAPTVTMAAASVAPAASAAAAAAKPAATNNFASNNVYANKSVSSGPSVSMTPSVSANEVALTKQVADLTAKLQKSEQELMAANQEIESLSITSASFDALQKQTGAMQAENDQLKAQIRQLSEQLAKANLNAGLEQQLKAAKDDVARLKAALLQNSTNANLWKEQLSKVEEENKVLTEKVRALEDIQRRFASVLGK